jgi:hypothetical protein
MNVDYSDALAHVRKGKAAAAESLRAALLASEDPYVQLWADYVGRLDDRVLDATPPGLLRECSSTADDALRNTPFTPMYNAPITPPYIFPVNGTPPASFKPQTIADLMPPEVYAAINSWVVSHFPYLVQCASAGVNRIEGVCER